MIHAQIKKLHSHENWLASIFYSFPDVFANVESNKLNFQDIDLETNLSFGSFYCLKKEKILIDVTALNTYQVSLVFFKDKSEETFEIFLNHPYYNFSTTKTQFRDIQGKVFEFQYGAYYEYFVINFNSDKLRNKSLNLQKPKFIFGKSIQTLYKNILLFKPVKNSRIIDLTNQFFYKILIGMGYGHSEEVLYQDSKLGPISNYEQLIDIGFEKGIFDSRRFIGHFKLNELKLEKYFRGKYSQTFHQYFTKQKFQYAYQLITKQKLDLQEISNLIGYKSTNYVSSQLKRYYGRNSLKKSTIFLHQSH